MKDTILLTGATGALGSMRFQRLSDQGYDVVCLPRGKTRSDARAACVIWSAIART